MGFIYSQFFIRPAYPTTDLSGQTAIVTGSNVGLGKEAARHITRLGAAKVILAVRNTKAGEEARQDILSTTGAKADVVQVWPLDLSKYDSVLAFAKKAEAELERIDILLENAGIATDKFELAEGHERTITVNVISTFLLAFLLLPKLKDTAKKFNTKPRLSIVSSEVHRWTKFPEAKSEKGIFPALDDPGTQNMGERYPSSKLLEVLVIRQIAPKMADSGVILNYINPGLCHSELARNSGWGLWFLKLIMARSTEVGSRTLVAGASAGSDSHGKYIYDGVVNESEVGPFVTSSDGEAAARKVWIELQGILESIKSDVTKGF